MGKLANKQSNVGTPNKVMPAWCVILLYVTLRLPAMMKSALDGLSSVSACLLALPLRYTCI